MNPNPSDRLPTLDDPNGDASVWTTLSILRRYWRFGAMIGVAVGLAVHLGTVDVGLGERAWQALLRAATPSRGLRVGVQLRVQDGSAAAQRRLDEARRRGIDVAVAPRGREAARLALRFERAQS